MMKTLIKLIFGSIAIFLSLGLLAVLSGRRAFTRMVLTEIGELLSQSTDDPPTIVSEEMLDGLPDPIPRTVHLR